MPMLTFTISDSADGNSQSVARLEPNGFETPLYTCHTSSESKGEMTIARASDGLTVAATKCHTFSSKIDMTLNEQESTLKKDQLTGAYKFTSPALGDLQWKTGSLDGRLKLVDSSGTKLAVYNSHLAGGRWFKKKRGLEILVRLHPAALELCVVTGLVAVQKKRKSDEEEGEVAGEVFGALVGS